MLEADELKIMWNQEESIYRLTEHVLEHTL